MRNDGEGAEIAQAHGRRQRQQRYCHTTGSFEYFECSRYIWWANRQESLTKSDHKFMTKRMAKGLYSPLAWRCSTWRSQSGATTTLKPTSTFKRAVYDA